MFLEETGLNPPKQRSSSDATEGKNLRFWMPAGSTKHIIFLTEANKIRSFAEHQYKMNGKWTNWLTCLKGLEDSCPMCTFANTYSKYYSAFKNVMTVLNITKWKTKEGEERLDPQKQLLLLKNDALAVLKASVESIQEEGLDLYGAKFTVKRTEAQKSRNTGDAYIYTGHPDLSAYDMDLGELDYPTILAPDVEEVAKIAKKLTSVEESVEEAETHEPPQPEWESE